MRLIDENALVDALMAYTWRDDDERLIDDADEKRAYIKEWLPVLPTVDGWISVKDRLPDEKINKYTHDFQEVICTYCFYIKPGLAVNDVRVYKFGNGHFWHGLQIMDNVVTHWMPLPEPPKEDKT